MSSAPRTHLDLVFAATQIENIRAAYLLDEPTEGLCPEAEQFFLASIAALDTAQRMMSLANLVQTRAIAERIKD